MTLVEKKLKGLAELNDRFLFKLHECLFMSFVMDMRSSFGEGFVQPKFSGLLQKKRDKINIFFPT